MSDPRSKNMRDASAHVRQRLQFLDHHHPFGMERVPQIPVLLQAEPEVGAHAGDPGQPKRGIRPDGPLAQDDPVELGKRHAEPDSKSRLCDLERLGETPPAASRRGASAADASAASEQPAYLGGVPAWSSVISTSSA